MTTAWSFGMLVRRRRKALDLTQAALAQRVGCAESLIRKIEAEERRPSRQVAERMAEALQVAADERPGFVRLARGEGSADGPGFPSAPADAAPPATVASLPAPPTALVGRAGELLALGALLADPATRLVTIVAPGGAGKTRLAIAASERQRGAARFPDGVCFVDLSAVGLAAHVGPALATALGLPAHGGSDATAGEARLLAQLERRRLLLVLDNAEHLLDAAPLLAAIVRRAPGVVLLVTSRLRLQLQGEQLFPLGGLSIPADPALAAHSDASSLFLQAARRCRPGWEPTAAERAAIGAICRLTGGLPLALELAGAWAGVLAPAEILAELRRSLDLLVTDLRDLPQRQRSVRAVLDAAWRQLRPELRQVFARLAVFQGGFARAAAAEVAGATLRDLADLAGAALLSRAPDRERYALHALLRQYAAERLAEDPRSAGEAHDSHAAFYCAYLARHAPELRGAGQGPARAALEPEQENIEAAWRHAVRLRRPELLHLAAQPLVLFYLLRADMLRGAAAFGPETAALADEAALPPALRARLLSSCSAFRRPLGHADEAASLARRALELAAVPGRRAGPRLALEGYAHLQLALALDELGRPAALAEYTLALQAFRALGQDWDTSYLLYQLGRHACELDQHAEALGYAQESLALRAALGDRRGEAHSLQLVSQVRCATGQLAAALVLARQSHALFTQLDDPVGIAKGLRQIGAALFWQGRFAEARDTLERTGALYAELGLTHEAGAVQSQLAMVYAARGEGEQALETAARAGEQAGRLPAAQIEGHLAQGVALLTLGRGLDAEEQLRRSARLHLERRHTTPAAAPYLALCLLLRGAGGEARQLLAGALSYAAARRALFVLLPSLAAAALLLAERREAARVEGAQLALALPWIVHHRGLWGGLRPVPALEPQLDAVDLPPEVWQIAEGLAAQLV